MGKVSSSVGRISKPGRRFVPDRNLTTVEYKLVKAHNQRVGDVIHAHNLAHAALFLIFRDAVVRDTYETAINMWHSVQSDKAQRAMVANFVKHTTLINKTHKCNILWAITALDELSTFRNDAAHSEFVWTADRLMIGSSTKPAARARLTDLPFEKHWRALKGDLTALGNYLFGVNLSLVLGQPRSLYRRPRLQLARAQSAKTQEQRRRAKKAIRERQRQASPG